MLQRIQTVFLAIAALLCISMFFLPLASFSVGGINFDMYVYGIRNLTENVFLDFKINMILHLVLNIVITFFLILIIFLYKNRVLQIRLSRFCLMLNIVFISIIFLFADIIKKSFVKSIGIGPEEILVKFGMGSIIPLLILVFILLGIKFISKDENLVRSANRLR